jgi:A/G-specific adenine glycosylase
VRLQVVRHLSDWFKLHSRTLPWRSNPDPYWVWLSEVMLQQTQMVTVLPYFDRFISKFPTITDLADAPIDEVLKLWAGLGYYSRARNLHKGAKVIAERIRAGSGFPRSREEWLEVPGVGQYTAGAVTSIALNLREPIVDGNVERVLSRVNAWTKRDPKKIQIWDEARLLVNVPDAEPRILNQAMMELGALICRPKTPLCLECPLKKECKGKGSPELYPEAKAKIKWKVVSESRFIFIRKVADQNEIYLEQNQDGSWREGLWDFPVALSDKDISSGTLKLDFSVKYVVTNHKVKRRHQVILVKQAQGQGSWFKVEDLPALPAPVTRAIGMLKKLDFMK